jgi:kynurenine 3-monooxygenase
MPQPSPRRVIIVGAGLAGSLAAVALARLGSRVAVYERRSDPRAKGYIGGRSINLAVSARGIAGLAHVGLDREILADEAIAMPGRMIHTNAGDTHFQPYSANPEDAIHSFSRGGLNLALIHAAAREPNVSLFFDHPCLDVEFAAPAATFQSPTGTTRVAADLIVGTDGAYSAVRLAMQKTDRFEYSQNFLGHGYKELHIPARADTFQMEPHALHIWPRGAAMMIALPNRDHTFTNTLFWPWEGEHSFAALEGDLSQRRQRDRNAAPTAADRDRVASFFREHYPDAVPIMPTLVDDFFANPTSSLVTVRCWPWQREGKVVLLGDAAHAIVPFFGQGMNAAFEDVVALSNLLASNTDQRSALEQFERERKPNADAIADMALENFVEMRDLSGRPEFQLKKKYEQTIHAAFPDRVSPRYNLVSFSTVPYVEARKQGEALDAVIANVQRRMPPNLLPDSPDWRNTVLRLAREELDLPTPAEAIRLVDRDNEDPWLDISPPLSPTINVWPGDTPLSREVLCEMKQGSNITLSTLRSTVHLGAHADGANHYGLDAKSIDQMPIDRYIGLCRLVDVLVKRGERVRPDQVLGGIEQVRETRVLVRTGTFPNFERWNSDFAALSVELVEALAARGVKTIGIDTPSVDLQDSKDLPAHRAVLRHDIAILEGLALAGIANGLYELTATPLRLVGFDASPVRALLRRVPGQSTLVPLSRHAATGRLEAFSVADPFPWFDAVRQILKRRFGPHISRDWTEPVLREDAIVAVESPQAKLTLHVNNWFAALAAEDEQSDALVYDIARETSARLTPSRSP